MSVLKKLKKTNQEGYAYAESISQHDDIARFVCSEDGLILHGNNLFESINSKFEKSTNVTVFDFIRYKNEEDFYQSGNFNVALLGIEDVSLTSNWVHINPETKIMIASLHDYDLSFDTQDDREQEDAHNPFDDLSTDIQISCDKNGQVLSTNNNFIDLVGTASIESFFDFIHPEDRHEFQTFFKHLNHKAQSLKARAYNCSEMAISILWRAKKVKNKVYVVGRDISEREKYKATLKMHQKRLEEAEALAHIGQWEWVIGTDEICFSSQLYTIFGLEKSDTHPKLDDINAMIHEEDEDRMMQVFQRAMIEQKKYDMDFRIITPSEDIRYIRCEGRCKTDEDGDATSLYGIMQDATHSMVYEQGLIEAKEKAEKAYASKTQFLANMSHELRTPLNAVIGFSEMMERQLLGPIGTEKYLEYISGIRKSGEHLLSLISDILDMSKIEAGKYDLNIEKFNISKTAQLAAHMVEGRANTNQVKLKIDIKEEKIDMIADRRAILQIILNLLSNAVKFSHEKGEVTLSIQKNENFIFILVKDTGIGIPANKLATITQPFEQAQNHLTREYEGTGLGLAITKELTEIHGGSIKILSEVDVGTEVIVKLPKETKPIAD